MDASLQQIMLEMEDFKETMVESMALGVRQPDMTALLPPPGTFDCDLLSAFNGAYRDLPALDGPPEEATPARDVVTTMAKPANRQRPVKKNTVNTGPRTLPLKRATAISGPRTVPLKAQGRPGIPRIRICKSGSTWSASVMA